MKVLAWYILPEQCQYINILKTLAPYPYQKNVKPSLYIHEWYQKTVIPVQPWYVHSFFIAAASEFLFCFECSLGWLEFIGFIGEFKFQDISSRQERMRAYPMQSKLLHLKGIEKFHRSGAITIKFILICSPCVFVHLDKLQQQNQKCKDTGHKHCTEVVNRKRGNRSIRLIEQ